MPAATPAPIPPLAGAAIRTGIALLGAVGFALSYDALRQMAAAIHIREPLTYTFPLVIDGFIAIGVGALFILRTAPLPARLYVWALVGIATATSVWANALHAIRLNQQAPDTGLHLGDTTVAVLSSIAPLALAGATHLHILITRSASPRSPQNRARQTAAPIPYRQKHGGTPGDVPYQATEQRDRNDLREPHEAESIPTALAAAPDNHVSGNINRDSGTQMTDPAQYQPKSKPHNAARKPDRDSAQRGQGQSGRPPMATLEQLADVIAAAHPDPDAITRDSARKALTESGLGAATTRLTEAIGLVRRAAQADEHLDQRPLVDRA